MKILLFICMSINLFAQDSTYPYTDLILNGIQSEINIIIEENGFLNLSENYRNNLIVRVWIFSYPDKTQALTFLQNLTKLDLYYFEENNNFLNKILGFLGLYKPRIQKMNCTTDFGTSWQKILDLDILSLRDQSELNVGYNLHGLLVVVEINNYGNYRLYHYSNPSEYNLAETKKVENIIKIIYSEVLKKCN